MEEQIEYHCLENGLKCCYRKLNLFSDYVTMALIVRTGSMMECEGENGIAHLLEHWLMSFWTFNLCKDVNYQVEAHTDFYETIFYIKGPADGNNLFACIEILNLIAKGAFLENRFFQRAKLDVLREIKHMKNNNKTAKILLENSSYCKYFALGKEEDVKNLNYNIVRSFFSDFYSASNMALVVVGDIKNTKKVHQYVKKIFTRVPSFNVDIKEKTIVIPEYKGEVYNVKVSKEMEDEKKISVIMKNARRRGKNIDEYIREEIVEKIAFSLIKNDLEDFLQEKNLKVGYNFIDLDNSYMFYALEIILGFGYNIEKEHIIDKINAFFSGYDISNPDINKEIRESLDSFNRICRDKEGYYKNMGMHQLLIECIDGFVLNKPIISYDDRCDLYEKISYEIDSKDILDLIENVIAQGKKYIVYI